MLVFGQKMIWFVYPYYGNLITHVSIPFRQAIIGQCPDPNDNLPACQMLCASCLPPNVCNVFYIDAAFTLLDYNCVLPTEVNNRMLLYFRAGSAYLVTPQVLLTISDWPNVSVNSWTASNKLKRFSIKNHRNLYEFFFPWKISD